MWCGRREGPFGVNTDAPVFESAEASGKMSHSHRNWQDEICFISPGRSGLGRSHLLWPRKRTLQ